MGVGLKKTVPRRSLVVSENTAVDTPSVLPDTPVIRVLDMSFHSFWQ